MILVTGATGQVGSFLVRHLVEQGESVRGLAHTETSRATIERQGADAASGDFDDPESLRAVMQGCDHLFLLSPAALEQAERERRAIDVAADVGVEHVVALSILGADPSHDRRHGGLVRHVR